MGGGFGQSRQQSTGPTNLWSGYSQTPYQQPRGQITPGGFGTGQMMQPGFMGGSGYMSGYQQGWPGAGYGGMPQRYGGRMGMPGMGMSAWGSPFSGFSGGYNPYGPGSFSSPGAMPYGGGSGMFGRGGYNMMANQMAAIPYQQMARSRFSQPYQHVMSDFERRQLEQPQAGGMIGNVLNAAYNQNRDRTVMVPGVGEMSWGDYWG